MKPEGGSNAAGTLLLVVLVEGGVPVPTAAIAGAALTTAVRLLAVGLGWSFPAQQALVLRSRSAPRARAASPRRRSWPRPSG